uniref:Trehalose-6-phosphate synthase-7 n=1 Tax=Rhizophora mucronata TaxID=61149 RepID=A0A2P2MI93_RHIMU
MPRFNRLHYNRTCSFFSLFNRTKAPNANKKRAKRCWPGNCSTGNGVSWDHRYLGVPWHFLLILSNEAEFSCCFFGFFRSLLSGKIGAGCKFCLSESVSLF